MAATGLPIWRSDLGDNNDFYSPGFGVSQIHFSAINGEDQGYNGDTFEVIVGTDGDDIMDDAGGGGQNRFVGGAGNDTMTAAAGTLAVFIGGDDDDVMNGSEVGNTFRGGAGADTMNGGTSGDDLVRYDRPSGSAQFSQGVFVNLSEGEWTLYFNGEEDVTVEGGQAIDNWGDTDTLVASRTSAARTSTTSSSGNDGDNELQGLDGHDILIGGWGNDQICRRQRQ